MTTEIKTLKGNGFTFTLKKTMQNSSVKIDFSIDLEPTFDNYIYYGMSPLRFAVAKGQKEILELMLQHNANVNEKTRDGITPLMEACFQRNTDFVEILLEHGADIDSEDKNGSTALNYARGGTVITEILLKHKKTKLVAKIESLQKEVDIIDKKLYALIPEILRTPII